jgi:hypothetical protein
LEAKGIGVFLEDLKRPLVKRCQRRMNRGRTNKDIRGLEQVSRNGRWGSGGGGR